MQMSELARRSGLPVATVKYYLREGLLPPGVATSATRAAYDEGHVRRLRLIRALVQVGQLRLDAVRDVLAAVDDQGTALHDTVGAAHHALAPHGETSPRAVHAVDRLLRRRRWRVHPDSANRHALAVAFEALGQVGLELSDATLDTYADAAASVAKVDVENVPTDSPEHAVEYVVVGTVLLEPLLLALRRLCQEDQSGRRLTSKRVRTARPTRG
ncbi:MAG: MerR family transcriptional regulator [Actinomycetota bacterium]|nr:MerR family transcriptional regulator [Actinomycetota bacterium]